MVRQVSLRILTNTLLLLILAFVIVFLQFRNKTLPFHLGDFSITLYKMSENKTITLSHAKLEGRSLELNFGSDSSKLKEGLFEKPLSLVDYSTGKDTFTLFFEKSISVSFFLDQDNFLIISAKNLPSEAASIKTLLTLGPRASWGNEKIIGGAQLNYQKKDLIISLNNTSSYEELRKNNLYLSSQPIKIGPFIQREKTEPVMSLSSMIPLKEEISILSRYNFQAITDADLAAEQKNFRDKAYRGLVSRYNQNTNTWTRDSISDFSEKALIATLAESLTRGTYLTQLALMSQANIHFSDRTTVESALYLGDIVNKHSQTREQKQKQLAGLSRESAISMTIMENMANDLFLYGTKNEMDRIVALWETIKPLEQGWSLTQVSHFVANYERTRYLLGKDSPDSFLNFLEDLFNQFGTVNNESFILAEREMANIEASLRLASATLVLTEGSERFSNLRDKARSLMVNTLQRADNNGNFLNREATIYAEDVYHFVSASRYLPKIVVLSNTSHSWAMFSSDILSINLKPASLRFQLNFFTEMPEHIIFSQISYPRAVNFRGITWRTDPQFQIYTDGWSYLKKTQSLYLKISHLLGATIYLSIDIETNSTE